MVEITQHTWFLPHRYQRMFTVQFGFSTLVLNTQGQGMDGVFAESNVHGTVLSADISFKKYTDGKKKVFKSNL